MLPWVSAASALATGRFREQLPKVIRSYALDALRRRREPEVELDEDAPRHFVEAVEAAAVKAYPAIGMSDDIRLRGEGVAGGALVVGGTLVHLCAFADEFSATGHVVREPDF